jgi:hypothetical protein
MRFLKPAIVLLLILSLAANGIMYAKFRGKRPIFRVNDEVRTKADMDGYLEQQSGPRYKAMMVQRMMIDQEAKKRGLSPTDAEVDDAFNLRREVDWQFAQAVAHNPGLANDYKDEVRQKLEIDALLASEIPVTEEEIKDEYTHNPELYDTPNRAHAEVAAVINDAHADLIRQAMAKTDPPLAPADIMRYFPREVVFLGENNRYTFVQAYGDTKMNKDIFTMEPRSVKMVASPQMAAQGFKRIVIRLIDIVPGKKADLNDPKTLKKIKTNVGLRHAKPQEELIAELWAKTRFESEDPSDRASIEQYMLPGRSRTEAHAENPTQPTRQ